MPESAPVVVLAVREADGTLLTTPEDYAAREAALAAAAAAAAAAHAPSTPEEG